ncbi:Protein phosphatase 2C-like protein, partial [Lachnellula suecica]
FHTISLTPSQVSTRDEQPQVSKVAGSKRRSFSSQGGLLNRMFGSSGSPPKESAVSDADATTETSPTARDTLSRSKSVEEGAAGEKRSGNGSPQGRAIGDNGTAVEKKRRSSGVGSKASSLLASAKNSLHFSPSPNSAGFMRGPELSSNPLLKLGKQDPALSVPQGQHNNSAGDSVPTPRSTFSVGVWEDRNKKCRRSMEDTHAFLYNFLHTPAPALKADAATASQKSQQSTDELTNESSASLAPTNTTSSSLVPISTNEMMETDNGYFAIFDGHAGTFAADWCGKKLHIILEEIIRKNPNTPIPELLDQTFMSVDAQLEKLPVKNSGCTAVTAVLRWEDRIPNAQSATGSTAIAPATAAAVRAQDDAAKSEAKSGDSGVDISKTPSQQPNVASSVAASTTSGEATHAKLQKQASRQRVLYTANVGDARIVLCRNGKALRLSYDHKGGDENEGKRIANAGGLILNNRVNGVLAVTRALGDSYMKDLVTGHPYTTETVIQPDLDEFIILACDGLWDVCSDQEAVDLVRNVNDPIIAAKQLVEHALARFSTDNLSCMVVRLNKHALLTTSKEPIGVEGDATSNPGKISEAEKIVGDARRKVQENGVPGIGVSGSNFGEGHDPKQPEEATEEFKRVSMERVVEEEPSLVEGDAPELDLEGANAISPDTRSKLPLPQGAPK